MWKKVKISNEEFLIQHTVEGLLHKIYVTDIVHLWYEEILEQELLGRCKEMNKFVEASDEVFLSHIGSLMKNESSDVIREFGACDTNCKTLILQTKMENLKFRIKFLLKPANHVEFFEEVTCPLLTAVLELQKRQQCLIEMIKRKDAEILEYKLEGGQISRKAVETEQFDEDAFSIKCTEGLSATKSLVAAHPTQTLIHPVQDLLEKIAAAPKITIEKPPEEVKPNKDKVTTLKLRSPTKTQKLKEMYVDEDDTNENKKDDEVMEKEIKTEQESQPSVRPSKRKYNSKKLLPNL